MKIERYTQENKQDLNKANQPFHIIGRLKLYCNDGQWSYDEVLFDKAIKKQYPNYDGAKADDYINSNDRAAFLAYEDNLCVGQILLARAWNKYAHIEDISVSEDYRGKGIGGALLKTAEKWANENGLYAMSLECQDNNIWASRFYKKKGFFIGGVNTRLYSMLGELYENETAVFWYKTL